MHIRNYTIYTLATTLVKKPRLIHWTFLRAGLNYIVVYKKKIKHKDTNEWKDEKNTPSNTKKVSIAIINIEQESTIKIIPRTDIS